MLVYTARMPSDVCVLYKTVEYFSCYQERSCASQTITNNGGTISCYGFASCYNSSIIDTSDNDIDCHGSYSCYNAEIITHIKNDTTRDTECAGLFSCANAKYIINAYDGSILTCSGEKSCFHTTMWLEDSVRCWGDSSCSNSKIYV